MPQSHHPGESRNRLFRAALRQPSRDRLFRAVSRKVSCRRHRKGMRRPRSRWHRPRWHRPRRDMARGDRRRQSPRLRRPGDSAGRRYPRRPREAAWRA